MTTEHDTARAVRAWLEEGVNRLPDRVLDAVLDEVPSTRQRRKSLLDVRWRISPTSRLLATAVVILLIIASLAVTVGTIRPRPSVPAIPFGVGPLEKGRYVIDSPFPVRISLDVPNGWGGAGISETAATLSADGASENPATLEFTFVDAVHKDPCHYDASPIEVPGTNVDDLANVLADLQSVETTPVTTTSISGHEARRLTITAPQSFDGCRAAGPRFRVWAGHGAGPDGHWLEPAERNTVWIAEVGGRRLVVSAEIFADTRADVATALDAMIASIRLGESADVVVVPPPSPLPIPTPERTFVPLRSNGVLEKDPYLTTLQAYTIDSNGLFVPVDGRFHAVFEGRPGWVGTARGLASDLDEPARASLEWWTVGIVYRDPCHWQSSALGAIGPSGLRDQSALIDALSRYRPAPDAPIVTGPPRPFAWHTATYELTLTIPADLDLQACDEGVYRLWAGHDGTPRTGRPGERIRIHVMDFQPGLLIVATSVRPDASPVEMAEARAAFDSLYIGLPPRQ